MYITNKTSFAVIAVIWQKQTGYGEEISIKPNETEELRGPYLGEMGGGDCYIHMDGNITCHEEPDNSDGYHVSKGDQLVLIQGDRGVTIRHHSEEIKFQEE